jgi:hypothetical protein
MAWRASFGWLPSPPALRIDADDDDDDDDGAAADNDDDDDVDWNLFGLVRLEHDDAKAGRAKRCSLRMVF